MYKSCSRCGRIHASDYDCRRKIIYKDTAERRLRSKYAWTQKAQEIKSSAQYLCEVCRAEGRYTYDGLEVHHITPLKEDSSGLLDNSNLICLCVEHHKLADSGKIDREFLRSLADLREKRSPIPF